MFGDEKYEHAVCPGYLVNQPLVGEIVAAWRAFESGNWGAMYPNAPAVLDEGVRHFTSVREAYQAWLIRKDREEQRLKNGRS